MIHVNTLHRSVYQVLPATAFVRLRVRDLIRQGLVLHITGKGLSASLILQAAEALKVLCSG